MEGNDDQKEYEEERVDGVLGGIGSAVVRRYSIGLCGLVKGVKTIEMV